MRRLLVLVGSSPRRQVSDLRLYEASGSDRTDGFGSIGSEPAGSGSARASLAFEMSNGSDSESDVSFDLGADLETSTASCTADTEDKVELRASKSGGSSASSGTEDSRVDRAVEQPSGEQYTTRRIKEEKRLRAEFEVSVVRLVAGIERSAEELAEKPGEFHDFYMACRRDATALRKAADAKLKSGSATGRGRAVVLRRFAQKRARLAEAAKSLAEGAGHAEGSAQAWAQFGVRALGELAKCENFEGLICL